MIEYRKQGLRTYYRIDDETVVKVINKHKVSFIECSNVGLAIDVATDPYETEACTKQEFNTAYQEALERIQKMKIE